MRRKNLKGKHWLAVWLLVVLTFSSVTQPVLAGGYAGTVLAEDSFAECTVEATSLGSALSESESDSSLQGESRSNASQSGDAGGSEINTPPSEGADGSGSSAILSGAVGGSESNTLPSEGIDGGESSALPSGGIGGSEGSAISSGGTSGGESNVTPSGGIGGSESSVTQSGAVGGSEGSAIPSGGAGGSESSTTQNGAVGGGEGSSLPGVTGSENGNGSGAAETDSGAAAGTGNSIAAEEETDRPALEAAANEEPETQTADVSFMDGEALPSLSAVNGEIEVVLTKQDGSYFEAGTVAELLTVADFLAGSEKLEEACEEQTKLLRAAWNELLAESYIDTHPYEWTAKETEALAKVIDGSISGFLPCFVRVTDASGDEIPVSQVELTFRVCDTSLYEKTGQRTVNCFVGRHDETQRYGLFPEDSQAVEVQCEEPSFVACRITAAGLGWFSIVWTDPKWMPEAGEDANSDPETSADTEQETESELFSESESESESETACECGLGVEEVALAHAFACPVFCEALAALCDCGAKEAPVFSHDYECAAVLQMLGLLCGEECDAGEYPWIWHEPECPAYNRVLEALCTCGSPSQDVTEHEEACEALEYAFEMQGYFFSDVSVYAATSPDGTPVVRMPSYTKVNYGSLKYSNKYIPLRTYSNSVMTPWCTDQENILTGYSTSANREYFLPKTANAKGKCGWRVTNVGYDRTNNCYLDLKITLNNYANSCKTASGGTVTNVYPHVGMYSSMKVTWDAALPNFELKYEIVKSGTDTLMPGNYRFQWLDIDDLQRFGISVQDGAIDAKYCLTDATPYGETYTYFGHTYECINAINTSSSTDDNRYSVWFDISNTSTFYMFVGQTGNRSASRYSQATIKERYASSADGSRGAIAVLAWNASAPGPVEPLPAPVTKAVSNDGINWGTSNTLSTITSEYWYQIEAYVPYEAEEYYYNYFTINDVLPAGVDYVGEFSATKVESGQNVTGYFTVSSNNDQVSFTAAAEKMGAAAFYGYCYRFRFKVRMDPTEITPQRSGNTAVYTVQNCATASARHKTESTVTSRTTNTVTTTASESRIQQQAPYKRLDSNENLTAKKLGSDEDLIIFSIYQTVPANGYSWYPDTITMTDILEDCLEYVNCGVAFKAAGTASYEVSRGWGVSAEGQKLVLSRAYLAAFGGGMLRFDIQCRVKERVDLDKYYQTIDGSTWAVIPNTAKVKFDWKYGSPAGIELPTNQVTVQVPLYRAVLEILKTNADTGETIPDAGFTVYEWKNGAYSSSLGVMKFDAEKGKYRMENLVWSAANQGKFKVIETTTPAGHTGTWEQEFEITKTAGTDQIFTYQPSNPMAKGTITVYKRSEEKGTLLSGAEYEIAAEQDIVSPQGKVLVKAGMVVDTLKTNADGMARSRELYPGAYLVTETKAPAGYACDTRPQAVAVVYEDKDTPCTDTELTFINERLYGYIKITKELDSADLVWAHGNPAFTFCVEGKDLLDVPHTYFETVEFTPDCVTGEKKVSLTVQIKVLAGTYTVSEEKTMRYALDSIHSVSGGTIMEHSVQFDLREGGIGAATFYNKKTTDEDLSHTAFVRNTIKS